MDNIMKEKARTKWMTPFECAQFKLITFGNEMPDDERKGLVDAVTARSGL
jgi:hypothetical protein